MDGGKLRNKKCMILGMALLAFYMLGAMDAYALRPVVVFLSSDDEAYTRPVDTFIDKINMPVEIINLHGDVENADARMTEILSRDPALIFALGAKAAYIAKLETLKRNRQAVPVVFAMVLNWERYELLKGSDNIAGIATDIDPGTTLANMKMFAPKVKTVGVIYSDAHSSATIKKARRISGILGYELIAEPIKRQKEFRRVFDKMADGIQAYWILTDPVVFSTRNMNWLEKRCVNKRIITIGQSENVVRLGILLGINTDASNIGAQAASMARNIILHDQTPKSIGVMPPLGTSLILNAKTADRIGLEIDQLALGMTSKIVE
jgi:putative tryptophan/tyrosine transport system substrate-binding protein